jgi:hypothetical protein
MPGGVKNLRRNKKLLCPVPKKAWGQPGGQFGHFLGRNHPGTIFQLILEHRLPNSDYLATP